MTLASADSHVLLNDGILGIFSLQLDNITIQCDNLNSNFK